MTPERVLRALRDGEAVALGPLVAPDEGDVLRVASRALVERWARGAALRTDGLVALSRDLQLVRRWTLATGEAPDAPGVGPAMGERLGEAARAWLQAGSASEADTEVFRALRVSGFEPAAPADDPLLALPRALLREALGAQPRGAVEQLREALRETPDPAGTLAPALSALSQAMEDRELAFGEGPAAALLALVSDAGAGEAAWLRSGGRMVAGWGRLRRRYPALLALVHELPPWREAGADDPDGAAVAEAFAATARGEAARATAAIEHVEAALPVPWFEGLLLRADLAETRGDVDAARSLLVQARALAPDRPDTAIILCDLETFEGNDAAALAALEGARRVAAVKQRRALAHYRLGHLTQAAGLGFAPERRPAAVPEPPEPVTGAALTLLDPSSDAHARAAAFGALGHEDDHVRALAALFEGGQATEAEVVRLAERATLAPSLPVDRVALAEQLLVASGAALPGAAGVVAADGAALAAALLRQAGAQGRAAEVTQARRDVLDRTLEAGETGPAVTAALLDMAADLVDAGRLEAFEGRSSWILRSIREAAASDAGVLARAARLVRSLAPERPDDAARVADAALTLLPDDEAGIDTLPADAATAAFELLTLRHGPEHAQADSRFAHAAPRRVATARDLEARGRIAEASTVAAAVLRKPLAVRDRADMLAVLAAALDRPEAAEEARAALLREVAGLGEAARTDPAAARTTLLALTAVWDPAMLAQARARILAAWRTRALPPEVAAAGADLVGHGWAAWLLTPGEGPAPDDAEVLRDVPGGPYFVARAVTRGRADRGDTQPARKVAARSPLPLPLVEAVRSGAPLLDLAAQLARANYDPRDALALLVQ